MKHEILSTFSIYYPWFMLGFSWFAVLFLSYLDIYKAFRRFFVKLTVDQVNGVMFASEFRDSLIKGVFGLGLRLRIWLWPISCSLVLLIVCYWDPTKFFIEGVLPHTITEKIMIPLQNEKKPLGVAALMIFLYIFIRIPPEESKVKKVESPSVLNRIIAFYYTLRYHFLMEVVFSSGRNVLVTNIIVDIENQLKRYNIKITEFLKPLAEEIGQPANASDHQILIDYLETEGAPALIQKVFAAGVKEFRRRILVEIELRNLDPEQGEVISTTIHSVGCEEWYRIRTIYFSNRIPLGTYKLEKIYGKNIRKPTVVEVEHHNQMVLGKVNSKYLGKLVRKLFFN